MLITEQNEIISLMPTARWDRPQQLFGYIEEEETVALEPLLGNSLYQHLLAEYDRLREKYGDITATSIRPTGKAKGDVRLAYADVTERLEQIQQGKYREPYVAPPAEEEGLVPDVDMKTIRLIRICQQIEFYRMLSHKAGLLSVSFNEGGGANRVLADNYDPASEKEIDRMTKDAFMSAGRSVDSLLLFLEADAKGDKLFTEKWQEADAFYLHRDLLFQTARVMNEYLPLKGGRMDYVELVRDIRFCQNTYIKPRVGSKLLKAVVDFLNDGITELRNDDITTGDEEPAGEPMGTVADATMEELAALLRTALAFYVESRRVEIGPKQEKLARRDSMTDAQQAMAMACQWIEDNLDALGEAAVDSPIYICVREKEAQEQRDRESTQAACERRRRDACEQSSRKLFTAFPHTHRMPEYK